MTATAPFEAAASLAAIAEQAQRILAIDPGCDETGWLLYGTDVARPYRGQFGKWPNAALLESLAEWRGSFDVVVIEEIVTTYGKPVGREVFQSVRWSGRFEQVCLPVPVVYIPRKTVVAHLCGNARAKDGDVIHALTERYGGKRSAVGLKASPGPLYGIHKDVWQALALAVTYADTKEATR